MAELQLGKNLNVDFAGSSVMANAYQFDQFGGYNLRAKATPSLKIDKLTLGADVVLEAGDSFLPDNENTFIGDIGDNGTFLYDYQFADPTFTHAILRANLDIPIGAAKLSLYAKIGKIDVVEYVTCATAATDGNSTTLLYGGDYWVPRNFYIPGGLLGASLVSGRLTLTAEGMHLAETPFAETSGNTYTNGRFIVAFNEGSSGHEDAVATSIDVSFGNNTLTAVDEGDLTSYRASKNHVVAALNQKAGPVTVSVTLVDWTTLPDEPIQQEVTEIIPQVSLSLPIVSGKLGALNFDFNGAYVGSLYHQDVQTAETLDDGSGEEAETTGHGHIDNPVNGEHPLGNAMPLLAGATWTLPATEGVASQTISAKVMTLTNFSAEGDTRVGGAFVYTLKL